MMLRRPLLLASRSPRRRDLLREAGYEFQVLAAPVEELESPTDGIDALVIDNARRKCLAIAAGHPDAIVIGSDTLVALEEQPLGKPRDLDHAFSMLESLAGKTHVVATGVCLAARNLGWEKSFVVRTAVTFRPLSPSQIRDYLGLIDPLDKAGAYAAQDHGDLIIETIDGSWTNVVGLPMERLREELADFGVDEPLQLRRADPVDIPAIQSLARRIWNHCYPGIISQEQINSMLSWMYAADRLEREMVEEGVTFFLFCRGNSEVGYAALGPGEEADELHLHKFYLAPECHGQGLGSQLLTRIKDLARSQGARLLSLRVNRGNLPAIRCYERNGFAIERQIVSEIGNGFVMDDHWMYVELENTA